MDDPTALPFDLKHRGNGVWRGLWAEHRLMIEVAGTESAPDPACVATLADTVARWSDVRGTIATYCAELAAGHHVPLTPADRGGFAARDCGFDQPLAFSGIGVDEIASPGRVEVIFYTGFPDGYATYAIVLDGGSPVEIRAFAS